MGGVPLDFHEIGFFGSDGIGVIPFRSFSSAGFWPGYDTLPFVCTVMNSEQTC